MSAAAGTLRSAQPIPRRCCVPGGPGATDPGLPPGAPARHRLRAAVVSRAVRAQPTPGCPGGARTQRTRAIAGAGRHVFGSVGAMAEQPMIVVRGEAFQEVPPELATFSVSVTVRDQDRQAVIDRLQERIAGVRAVLVDSGDAVERHKTSAVQVFPEFKRGSERVVAYTGSADTTVTVTDFEALGQLLLRLAALPNAAVAGPWWQLRPGSRAGADVRREAIADALSRAREYAAAVGARVDRLVEIADEGTGGGGPMMRMVNLSAAEESAAFELDPQQQTVEAAVTVRVTITEPDLPK